ncbi:MAG TPA: hypothetical protein VE954_18340 [Oligoflexus sp.]|uniref:hypothetical protein n=1 Tax=Oligoflexus sp. TaxID=1971216 RepID=UPI002D5BDE5D|nr:hypothetical protein [Oligoflexus sp.]HYX35061.1 hypothetical protein [Oligoflexus sp.]
MRCLILKMSLLAAIVLTSMEGIRMALPLRPELFYEPLDLNVSWVQNLPYRISTIIMGSSTVYFGLDPVLLKSLGDDERLHAVNLSNTAQTPLRSLAKWKSLAPGIKQNIRTVIYGLDPWIMSEWYYRYDLAAMHQWSFAQRLYFLRQKTQNSGSKEFLFSYQHERRFVEGFFAGLSPFLPQPPTAVTPTPTLLGAGRDDSTQYSPDHISTEELYAQEELFPVSELYLNALAEIKQSAEQQGAVFILLLPPKTDSWIRQYREECRDFDQKLVASLRRRLGPTIVIGSFDLFSRFPTPDHFKDELHLNAKGQVLFTKWLADELLAGRKLETDITGLLSYRPHGNKQAI